MANRALFKPIHTSNGEAYASAEVELGATVINYVAPSKETADRDHEAFARPWTKECDRPANEIDEQHDQLLSSFRIAPTRGFPRESHPGVQDIYCSPAIDSPTLVPCPTPAITPAHSLRHMHAPIEAGKLFYQHESLVERILIASCASDSSDEAEEPEDTHLSDRDCFRFDDSKAALDMDDPLADLPVEIPKRCPTPGLVNARKAIGLEISGLRKRNVAEPFDGLGLVSIHRSRRHTSTNHHTAGVEDPDEGAYDSSGASSASTSNDSISSTILNETLLTLTDDPFHVHALNAIPECRSWYEIDHLTASSSSMGHMLISPSPRAEARRATVSTCSKYRVPPAYQQDISDILSVRNKDVQYGQMHCSRVGARHGPSLTTKPNFSSATISSELKRSTSTSVQKPRTTESGPTLRARSATWPNRNEIKPRGQIEEFSPKDHRKARIVSQKVVPMWRV